MTQHPFSRLEPLLPPGALGRLAAARVAVFGLGGVGGSAAEALARSGIGAIDLVDHDTVSLTNLNRQVIALHSTLGQYKTEVMARRIRDINPAAAVREHRCFYLPENADVFDLGAFDYIIDAIDTVTAKLELICRAVQAGTPLISCMGTGNRLDPSQLTITDLSQTSGCPLARVMRRELKKRGIFHVPVVFSREEAIKAFAEEDGARRAVPGSTAFVPPVAGMLAAGEVVRRLAGAAD